MPTSFYLDRGNKERDFGFWNLISDRAPSVRSKQNLRKGEFRFFRFGQIRRVY